MIRRRQFLTLLCMVVGSVTLLAAIYPRHTEAASADGLPKATWTMPADGSKPKIVVITIHGGSWFQNEGFYQGTLPYAQTFSNRSGAAGMNVEYASGVGSLPDLIESYDIARQRYPNLPICAYGWSAGGNLALLLANHRNLACVISEAGPTNLQTIGWPDEKIKNAALFFFGKAHLKEWSPYYTTPSIKQPTVLVNATNDTGIPYTTQAVAFKRKFPQTKLFILKDGDTHFIHTNVNAQQLKKVRDYEVKLVRQLGNQNARKR